VRLAVDGPVGPEHAPRPTNDAERLIFAQLYETLVNIDCTGRVYRGLAHSWTRDTVEQKWLFVLRSDARFWDGSRVTADDVVESLAREGLWSASLGPTQVVILLEDAPTVEPVRFADPRLAVSRRAFGHTWPLGTGAFQPAVTGPADSGANLALVREGDTEPAVAVVQGQGRDARDLLDDGVDMLITREPAVTEYATSLPQFSTVALPWTSTYVWASPAGSPPDSGDHDGLIGELRDAVRAESRAAAVPLWWQDLAACGIATPRAGVDSRALLPRLVSLGHDVTATGVAARLIVLARSNRPVAGPVASMGSDVVAAALGPIEFDGALHAGRDVGYVFALPRAAYQPCRAAAELHGKTPWLDPGTIVPLVDTRGRLVIRSGAPALAVDWDGTVRLDHRTFSEAGRQ